MNPKSDDGKHEKDSTEIKENIANEALSKEISEHFKAEESDISANKSVANDSSKAGNPGDTPNNVTKEENSVENKKDTVDKDNKKQEAGCPCENKDCECNSTTQNEPCVCRTNGSCNCTASTPVKSDLGEDTTNNTAIPVKSAETLDVPDASDKCAFNGMPKYCGPGSSCCQDNPNSPEVCPCNVVPCGCQSATGSCHDNSQIDISQDNDSKAESMPDNNILSANTNSSNDNQATKEQETESSNCPIDNQHSPNALSATQTTPPINNENRVSFDLLVESERIFIQKKIKETVYEDFSESNNPCVSFYRWLVSQFEKLTHKVPSSTLMSNLEFIQTNCDRADLFIEKGSPEKISEYAANIESANMEDYENECDVYALATSCKEEIQRNFIFFDEKLRNRILAVYDKNCSKEERSIVMKRVPFLMNYRPVFKLIKEIIIGLDMKKAVLLQKSLNIWVDIICSFESPKELRIKILEDLLKVEYDKVPLYFYD